MAWISSEEITSRCGDPNISALDDRWSTSNPTAVTQDSQGLWTLDCKVILRALRDPMDPREQFQSPKEFNTSVCVLSNSRIVGC